MAAEHISDIKTATVTNARNLIFFIIIDNKFAGTYPE